MCARTKIVVVDCLYILWIVESQDNALQYKNSDFATRYYREEGS